MKISQMNQFKYGDIRGDGFIFYQYIRRRGRVYESWLSPEALEKIKARSRKRYRDNPDAAKRRSREWHSLNKNKASVRSKEYAQKNQQAISRYQKQWRADNRDELRSQRAGYYRKNKERISSYQANRRKTIPTEELAAYRRSHYENNKSAYIEAVSRRRAKEVGRGCTKDQLRIMGAIYEASRRLTDCTRIPHHVDHIMPLSRGGLHCPSNLQILTAKLNLRKHSSFPS